MVRNVSEYALLEVDNIHDSDFIEHIRHSRYWHMLQ